MRKIVTCYAAGNDRGWEAVCVDFDIAVQGASFDQVYDQLNVAICTYVADATKESPDQARRLLSRRTPWHVRWSLKLGFLWHWVTTRGDDDNGQSAGFTVACPA